MAFLVSPGVQVREIDVTNVVPAVSSSIGGFAGEFSWGPVDEVRTITSEKDLVSVFGEPKESDTYNTCLLYTSPSPRDVEESRMPSSA